MRKSDDKFSIKLKNGRDKAALAILVCYGKAFDGGRFVYSTGIKVPRKSFNEARPPSDVKEVKKHANQAYQDILNDGAPLNSVSLKNRIELYRNKMRWVGEELHVVNGDVIDKYLIPDGVDHDSLEASVKEEQTKAKPRLKKLIETTISGGSNELFGFWEDVLSGKIKPRNGKALRKSTIRAKRQTLRAVKEFRPSANFDSMDRKFYNDFMAWMKDKGLDENTCGRNVKELKSILHLASANELMTDQRFTYWPVIKLKNEVVALSKEELEKIIHLKKIEGRNLTETQKNVRDIFVIACFSGARISDFKSFTKEDLATEAGITYLRYKAQKTHTNIKLPLHPIAVGILDSRDGEFPKMIAEQNFRYVLKEICKAALASGKNKDQWERVTIRIRDEVRERRDKWQAISPHSSRRTFATSFYYGWFARPMPANLVMRYTGHKSESSFLLYIGADEKDLDKKALEYFEPVQMKVS